MFDNYNNIQQQKISMRPNTTTDLDTQTIQEIKKQRYNQDQQGLNLCTSDVDLGNCDKKWRSVLKFQNWTALRALSLCYSENNSD